MVSRRTPFSRAYQPIDHVSNVVFKVLEIVKAAFSIIALTNSQTLASILLLDVQEQRSSHQVEPDEQRAPHSGISIHPSVSRLETIRAAFWIRTPSSSPMKPAITVPSLVASATRRSLIVLAVVLPERLDFLPKALNIPSHFLVESIQETCRSFHIPSIPAVNRFLFLRYQLADRAAILRRSGAAILSFL